MPPPLPKAAPKATGGRAYHRAKRDNKGDGVFRPPAYKRKQPREDGLIISSSGGAMRPPVNKDITKPPWPAIWPEPLTDVSEGVNNPVTGLCTTDERDMCRAACIILDTPTWTWARNLLVKEALRVVQEDYNKNLKPMVEKVKENRGLD